MSDTHKSNSIKPGFLWLSAVLSRSLKTIRISAILYISSSAGSISHLGVLINSNVYETHFRRIIRFGNFELCRIEFDLPLSDVIKMPIHNSVTVQINSNDPCKVSFNAFCKRYLALHTPFISLKAEGLVAFFRQNIGKGTTFTVRHANYTDCFGKHFKLTLAWLASKLTFWINPVLIFEKNGRHYEESGRAVYEQLIDEGNRSVRFILADDVMRTSKIAEPYKKRIVRQHTFKHYLLFFRCRTFLGTEALAHAIELRCQHLFAQRKLKSRKLTYVFLQHGVMYMISLNSPQRTSFRRRNVKGKFYVVASSEKEAQHFIDYAGFSEDEIIVCGLPKFDRSYLNDLHDKILVMPTWRIWEFAQMREDPQGAPYTMMVKQIMAAIPDDLKDKVLVATHPLFNPATFSVQPAPSVSYDELLRDVSLLITDYSSIAYDAFYRGSNVVFWWQEKDECMQRYGKGTHLMIDEQTAFGPVCYAAQDLTKAIRQLYGLPQKSEYQQHFSEIVEHHDDCNTRRLITELKNRGILAESALANSTR